MFWLFLKNFMQSYACREVAKLNIKKIFPEFPVKTRLLINKATKNYFHFTLQNGTLPADFQ